ncbi:MAG: winged helix-turn-helix transcriptional regulator [Chlorobia bacterium]|nr:winged helix-turn-helix transcriptional regulator [Fimbriimonadaceae bacterium]
MATERMSLQSDSLTAQALLMNELLNAAMEPALAVQGLKPSTFDLLSTIHAAGPDATQASIAKRLGIKPPSLTESLRLVKHLVEQAPSATDSRVKHLRLTAHGSKALSSTIKSIDAISKAITSGIDRDQLSIAVEVLKKANKMLAQTM